MPREFTLKKLIHQCDEDQGLVNDSMNGGRALGGEYVNCDNVCVCKCLWFNRREGKVRGRRYEINNLLLLIIVAMEDLRISDIICGRVWWDPSYPQ